MTRRALVLGSLAQVLSGCVTTGALVDLVVPSGIAEARVKEESGAPRWIIDYGREPHDIGHFPIRLWITNAGVVELPAGSGECCGFDDYLGVVEPS